MHNVNVSALKRTIEAAREKPEQARQQLELGGAWNAGTGPQFHATIPYPGGEVAFQADFPPMMGGSGSAPNPLAYCFWGGLACYAMTFAQEAALQDLELRELHATVRTTVDLTRALGVSDRPPVELLEWELTVDADVGEDQLAQIKALADAHCPGVWCLTNPVALQTSARRA
jgi:uncharacterized OsmC-like protein